MALCLRKSKQGLGEETDEDTEREKNNENKQADCRGFTLSFLNRLLWNFFYKVGGGLQLSTQRGRVAQVCSSTAAITTGRKPEIKQY